MRVAHALLFLLAAAAVLAAFVLVSSPSGRRAATREAAAKARPARVDPLKAHAPCRQQTVGSPERWLCVDGAWDLYPDGHLQSGGQLTPHVGVPKG